MENCLEKKQCTSNYEMNLRTILRITGVESLKNRMANMMNCRKELPKV